MTGGAANRAAKNNAAVIGQNLGVGADALTTGTNNALATLGTRGSGATALSALAGGYSNARDDLNNQYGQTQGYLGQLGQLYNPLVQQGGGAYSAYSDAIGANGAEGSQRATDAFRAAPGYEYAQNQALEAVQRSAAARGGLAGGNATADILKTATGLADQGYQQYVNNLQNGSQFFTQGLAGQGSALQGQANASINQGTALGNLGTSYGTNAGNLFTNAANIENGFGQNVSNLWGNATNALVQNNNNKAAAQNAASANMIGLGMNALTGLTKLFG
ncbi:hypothetical protein LNAOJCKE_0953 [Methylorubrum aminovorans]|uniref:DNA transfer protein n=1 Tax=Methylorubrum aminovorans TaxID=269069 RepID=A0ABQ4UD97_9HYPH|nr:hypothetical protein [Methylorubrum aminovorans]GJE63755.1 hypothetical protein LNAOJCKE_0953 [Methylorubrum aminovorans]GMA73594.1 hypothetical protein GCM10025880_00110 [Methylorubrum aminovorans]GMA73682.1 hypothetical protein GCM10025880_00990 [Methylorubrum aminovorans]